jgi:alkylation response protein AidB-like acyl-CoA dehydrogenase
VGRQRLEDLHHERRHRHHACVTITARTGEDEISNLIVPNGTPGYEISAPMEKLGWRASDTRELSFRGLRRPGGRTCSASAARASPVPRDPRRRPISVAAMGVGPRAGRVRPRVRLRAGARAVRQADLEVPGVQFQLADMAVEIEAGRALTYKAAWLKGRGTAVRRRRRRWQALTPAELSHRAANAALQIHGGYGFMEESAISRLYRDQKILEIGEGTTKCSDGDRPAPRPLNPGGSPVTHVTVTVERCGRSRLASRRSGRRSCSGRVGRHGGAPQQRPDEDDQEQRRPRRWR